MFRDVNRHAGEDVDRWSHPPNGGTWKLICLGIILPIVLVWVGFDAWVNRETIWLFVEGMGTANGRTAMALAVTYWGAGLFSHSRWFWRILPFYPAYEIGSIVALLLMVGGAGYAMWWEIFV